MRNHTPTHAKSGRNRPQSLVWLLLLAAALSVLLPVVAAAQTVSMTDVEKAILAADSKEGRLKEKWTPVVIRLKSINVGTADPVLRMIKGHVCLAANQNNESACLFLSVRSEQERQRWLVWANKFATDHGTSPIAHYFRGDALARLGRWKDAIDAFGDALAEAENNRHALAFNARGVAHALAREWNVALEDLHFAKQVDPGFADPYANWGAMCIQKNDGAPGALKAFDRALHPSDKIDLSDKFALALYGRGAARYVLGQWKEAAADVRAAMETAGCSQRFLAVHVDAALARISAIDRRELASAEAKNPSMFIDRVVTDMSRPKPYLGIRGSNFRNALKYIANNPGDVGARNKLQNGMNQAIANNAKLADRIDGYIGAAHQRHEFAAAVHEGMATQTSISGQLGAAFPVGPGLVGGNIGGSRTTTTDHRGIAGLHRQQARTIDVVHQEFRSLRNKPQGFKTSLAEATWLEGNWPFSALYGLCYFYTTPDGASVQNRGEVPSDQRGEAK